MEKRVQILLLGIMIWFFRFMAGGIGFGGGFNVTQIIGLEVFAATLGLALALFLVFRDKGQDYKRTGMEAGIIWFVILSVMQLILVIAIGERIDLWYPELLLQSKVLIIPAVVGYLLANIAQEPDAQWSTFVKKDSKDSPESVTDEN